MSTPLGKSEHILSGEIPRWVGRYGVIRMKFDVERFVTLTKNLASMSVMVAAALFVAKCECKKGFVKDPGSPWKCVCPEGTAKHGETCVCRDGLVESGGSCVEPVKPKYKPILEIPTACMAECRLYSRRDNPSVEAMNMLDADTEPPWDFDACGEGLVCVRTGWAGSRSTNPYAMLGRPVCDENAPMSSVCEPQYQYFRGRCLPATCGECFDEGRLCVQALAFEDGWTLDRAGVEHLHPQLPDGGTACVRLGCGENYKTVNPRAKRAVFEPYRLDSARFGEELILDGYNRFPYANEFRGMYESGRRRPDAAGARTPDLSR